MKIAGKLITALNECNEWGQIYILESLMYVTPQSSDDAETVIERIMPRLQHGNSGVVLVSVKVIAYMMNYVARTDTLEPILRKLSPPLVTLLSSGPEVQYIALRNIQLLLQRWPTILQNQLRAFFCKYDDPIYVKLAKLEIILSLTTEENARVVLTELVEYATEIDVDFVRKAVRSIGRIAIKIELAADRSVRALMDLIQTKVNYVVQEAIVVIRDIFRKYPNRYESIIGTLCENLDTLDEPEARAAMIWIIGQYADRIENSDEVLGRFLETFLEDPAEVQLALLTAVVKLFIMRPTAGQDLVPKVLKWATEEIDSPDIRDRGFIYWRLLSTDPEMARTVVLSEKPEISAEGEKLDMPLLEELLLQVGTLSSIYRKPPSTFIPFAKRRVLGASAALTRLTIAAPPVSRLPRTNTLAKSQATKQAGGEPAQMSRSSSSSAAQNPSMVDVANNAAAGLSNPYLNDVVPMPGNDAALIDLMSMDYDEEPGASGQMALDSGGMFGFNANFGTSGMNLASLDMVASAKHGGSGGKSAAFSTATAPASTAPAVASAGAGTAAAPDSQLLSSAFDAAGLDALSNLPTSASAARLAGNQSPKPDMARQFTSSFDVSGSAANSSSQLDIFQHSISPFADPVAPTVASPEGTAFASVSPFSASSLATSSPFAALSLGASSVPFSSSSFASSTPAFVSGPNSAGIAGPAGNSSSVGNLNTAGSFTSAGANLVSSASNLTTPITAESQPAALSLSATETQMYSTGLADGTYVPARRVLLDAQQGQGLEITGTFARRNGRVQLELGLANRSGMALGDFALQFNKNTYGLQPSSGLNVGVLAPGAAAEAVVPLATGGPSMAMQPLTNVQIAVKSSAGVFYFQTQYSLHILLSEGAASDQGEFLRMWRMLPDAAAPWPVHGLRFGSADEMRDKLNRNNVHTVAQRTVGAATHFYTSSKLGDGSVFYSEIKVAGGMQAALMATKSANAPAIAAYQQAVADICTAMNNTHIYYTVSLVAESSASDRRVYAPSSGSSWVSAGVSATAIAGQSGSKKRRTCWSNTRRRSAGVTASMCALRQRFLSSSDANPSTALLTLCDSTACGDACASTLANTMADLAMAISSAPTCSSHASATCPSSVCSASTARDTSAAREQ
ncbi:hypothetical protein H4S02_004170 [Coemansia sp. RSA 2611]|nr:hypothetical protein H4S02_004170 [Coemansia sp. RSA 2611]